MPRRHIAIKHMSYSLNIRNEKHWAEIERLNSKNLYFSLNFPVYMEISGTLTVKHFLYKGLPKTFESDNKKRFPIYTRIGLGKAQFDFKSDFQSLLEYRDDFHDVALKEIGYKTEKEFESVYEKIETEIGKAIEVERKIIWEIGDLLRKHNYNPAQKGGRQVINHLMKPMDIVINEVCVSLLRDTIYNSSKLDDLTLEFQMGINWESRFSIIYKLLSSLSNKPLSEIILKFKEAYELFPLIKEFEKFKEGTTQSLPKISRVKSDHIILPFGNILSYQWKYYELENEFQSFLRNKGLPSDAIDNTLSVIIYSLNRYFSGLKISPISNSIFPSPSLKPLPIRS